MAPKKSGPGSLSDRMRAVTGGGPKSPSDHVQPGQGPASPKTVRKRRSERKDAFKQGELIAAGTRVAIVLRNISETGARVDFFTGGTAILDRAQLVIPSLGLRRWVRVVWKDRNSAGLEFERD